ncbi:MAG: zinc ribbon domain-containing protein [Methanobacteriaceae archaeon]
MSKYCTNCGTEINDNSLFCKNCGKKLSGINTVGTGRNNYALKFNNRNKVLITIIVILIIIIATTSAYILYNSPNNNNNLPVNNSSSLPASDNLNNISESSQYSNVLSKTVYLTQYNGTTGNVAIGYGDNIGLIYSPYKGQFEANTISITIWCSGGEYSNYYKLNKATVYYENSNGKTITETYYGESIYKKVPTGYKVIKAVVYYEKK